MLESMRNWLRTRRGSGSTAGGSDAKWLEGYGGQTTDELIDLADTYRIDSVVVALDQAIQAKEVTIGDSGLSGAERIVLAVEALERDVNNDGFEGFFRYNAKHVPGIVGALEAIDAQEVAEITRSAIASLRIGSALDRDKVETAMNSAGDDERDAALEEADNRFFALRIDLASLLLNYVRANRDQVKVP
jgi:hypothetical protein